MTKRRSGNLRLYVPWLLFFILVIIPTLIGTTVLAIRSGLFHRNGPVTNSELKVFWTFAGVMVAGAVSLTGYLLTRGQHRMSEQRLALDTTVSGLKLITNQDGSDYAPKAAISGALATLIHLHQPIIAMRTLSAAWQDQAIDSPNGVWLISEVIQVADEMTQLEATMLLRAHSGELCGKDPGAFNWPPILTEKWYVSMPVDARVAALEALLRMLLSKPRSWWAEGDSTGYFINTLDEAIRRDSESLVKTYAAKSLRIILKADPDDYVYTSAKGDKSVRDIRKRLARTPPTTSNVLFEDLIKQLTTWFNTQ